MEQNNIKVGDFFTYQGQYEKEVSLFKILNIHSDGTYSAVGLVRNEPKSHNFFVFDDNKNARRFCSNCDCGKYTKLNKSDAYKFLLKQFDDEIAKLENEKLNLALKFFN